MWGRSQTGRMAEAVSLVYPVYLDIPMMVSFLAALTGGIAWEGERTIKEKATSVESGGVKLGVIAQLLQIGVSLQAERGTSTEEETRMVWQHTAASLLNDLRHRLIGSIGRLSGMPL